MFKIISVYKKGIISLLTSFAIKKILIFVISTLKIILRLLGKPYNIAMNKKLIANIEILMKQMTHYCSHENSYRLYSEII